jgi:hypothetical protein
MPGGIPNNDVLTYGKIGRALPQKLVDTFPAPDRSGPYGEKMVQLLSPRDFTFVDEGSEFQANSPTPGTGIAQIAAPTAFVATSPYLLIQNPVNVGPVLAKSLYLKYIKLSLSVVQVGNTTLNFVAVLDNILRYTSGGAGCGVGTAVASLNGPFCANFNAASGSNAQVYAGALVATAASNAVRMLGHGPLRLAIPPVGDTYTWNFGGHENNHTSLAKNGTAPSDFVIPLPPVVVAPGGCFLLYLWAASQSGAGQFEVDIGWVER